MNKQSDSRVTLYPDGKYRWVYEVPMLKNPCILFDVYKVLGIGFGVAVSPAAHLRRRRLYLQEHLEHHLRLLDIILGVSDQRLHRSCDCGLELWLEIRGALYARRKARGSPTDAPTDKEGQGAGSTDCACWSRYGQTRRGGVRCPCSFAFYADL